MFDILQAFFWSITYIFVIISSYQKKIMAIPPLAITSNFAWETVALLRDIKLYYNLQNIGMIIHIVWLSLDLIIVLIYFLRCKHVYVANPAFLCIYIIEVGVLLVVFKYIDNGMQLSSFAIDAIMAISWCIYGLCKRLETNALAVYIGIAKLLGDFFAWINYRNDHPFVFTVGIIVLLLNICYLTVLTKQINHR